MPATKVAYFTKLDPELREAMRRYKEAVGVPEAQQIDRALREWFSERPEAWASPAPKKGGPKPGARVRSRKDGTQ